MRGFGHLGDAEEAVVETDGLRLSARRHRQLHVLDALDRHATACPLDERRVGAATSG
jgi:hypothetical protein